MDDLSVTWGMDGSQASAGLDAVAANAKKSGKESKDALEEAGKSIEKSLIGVQAIGRAMGMGIMSGTALAVKAMHDYTAASDAAASKMEALEAIGARVWKNIGRDTSGLVQQMDGGILMTLERVRQSVVDSLAMQTRATLVQFGLADPRDNNKAIENAQRLEEMQTKSIKSRMEGERFINDLMASRYEKEGSLVEAAEIRARKFREQSMKDLQAKGVSGSDLSKAQNAINDESAKMIQDAKDAQAARQRKSIEDNAAYEAQKSKRIEDIGFDKDAMNIETLRLEGRKKEADLLQLELDTKKKISEIEKDRLLTEDQRNATIADIRSGAAAQRSAIENQKEDTGRATFRRIQGGLAGGGATLEALVFGGRSDPVKDTLAKIGYDQVKLLGRIADGVERDQVTVLA